MILLLLKERVEVNLGAEGWVPGTVIRCGLFWSYDIRLDTGKVMSSFTPNENNLRIPHLMGRG